MKPTGGDVGEFLAGVKSAGRRRDAETLIPIMAEVTGREPVLWGTIVGFGSCHYSYPTGVEGDIPVMAFSPRSTSTTLYLSRAEKYEEQLAALGPHTTGKSCLYIKDLTKVDLDVLRQILEEDYAWTIGGGDDYARLTVTG